MGVLAMKENNFIRSDRQCQVSIWLFKPTFYYWGSGLSPEVKKRGNLLMTLVSALPHQVMGLVLIGQIYRAFMIQQESLP